MTEINGKTKIVGIIGHPVTHTLSPAIQNAAFSFLKLNYVYVPFDIKPEKLKDAIFSLKTLNIVGFNVTIPHKEDIIPFLDELDETATKIGAVNTVINKNGKFTGYNTDCEGFTETLQKDANFNVENKNAVVIGAGGVARAIVYALLKNKIKKLTIANRTLENARKIADNFKKYFNIGIEILPLDDLSKLSIEIRNADIVINATAVGMEGVNGLLTLENFLHEDLFVFDAIYSKSTPLLTATKIKKIPSMNGLGMLVRQGAKAFKLWTGIDAPIDIMFKSLENI